MCGIVWNVHNAPKTNGNGANLAFRGVAGVCVWVVGKCGKFGVYLRLWHNGCRMGLFWF